MRRLRFLLLFAIAAVAATEFVPGTALSGESVPSWPQFHGPKRDNNSAETGLLKQWPEAGPKLLWTAKGLGHGFSSVSIAAGRHHQRRLSPGNQRRPIVRHDDHPLKRLDWLRRTIKNYGRRLHAFVLSANHDRLFAETPQPNLTSENSAKNSTND